MNPALFIARRYLFSQKKRSVINVISWISLIGIAISSMALIVVLSVYNGIGSITQSLFNIFDPELKIEAKEGKTFRLSNVNYNGITSLPTVAYASPIVEENMKDESGAMIEPSMTIISLAKALAVSFIIVTVSVEVANLVNGATDNFIIQQLFGQKYLLIT